MHGSGPAGEGDLTVRGLGAGATLADFLRVPFTIYAGDPCWVPPLHLERRQALSPRHPFFAHASWQGFVAYRAGRPVGRITAQIDRLYEARHGEKGGFFGLLEAPDDPAVFAALFRAAEDWCRARGAVKVLGPFNLGINQEVGILVDGFHTPPSFMMPHGRPYYGAAIEAEGYRGAQDLLAYVIDPAFETTAVMGALTGRLAARAKLRPLRRRKLAEDLAIVGDLFNDAWSANWGFVPFTSEEIDMVGREMRQITPEDFIQIAEVDGEPLAFIVLLPNLNEAIADLRGRLLPLGWAKLLWRLKVRGLRSARVPLMGVRRRLHNTRLGLGLAYLVIDAARRASVRSGFREVELSWILDDNRGMRAIIEDIGGQVSKRYRLYEKPIT